MRGCINAQSRYPVLPKTQAGGYHSRRGMIDDLYKKQMDGLWDRLGRHAARTGLTPNGVTRIAFVLSLANSALFLWHRRPVLYGLALAVIEALDNLDGAVARVTKASSRYGAFLDAATDRYKEVASLLAVAAVFDYWIVSFLAVTGSLLVSYNQARAQVEGAKGKGFGPDLFERFERVVVLALGLALLPVLPPDFFFGHDAVFGALALIAVASHLTAVQRFLRARRALLVESCAERR
jgi:archaetidylinositol phosphate synthase